MQLTCPICGGELAEQVTACNSCPMNAGCDMVCCENCGYETVAPKSILVEWARRLRDRVRGRAA